MSLNPSRSPPKLDSSLTPSPRPPERADLKEWVAAALAFGIVGFTLWAGYSVFSASAAQTTANMSSVLQTAIGLAGTVTGYYFGRIPAEKATQQANESAGQANAAALDARSEEARVRAQVATVSKMFRTPVGGAGAEADLEARASQTLRNILDQLDQIGR